MKVQGVDVKETCNIGLWADLKKMAQCIECAGEEIRTPREKMVPERKAERKAQAGFGGRRESFKGRCGSRWWRWWSRRA